MIAWIETENQSDAGSTKDITYLALTGILLWIFRENEQRHNGTVLYLDLPVHDIHQWSIGVDDYTLHWNGNVVILTKFSSLAALEVVILTTFSAASDENFIKMKTFPFQCTLPMWTPANSDYYRVLRAFLLRREYAMIIDCVNKTGIRWSSARWSNILLQVQRHVLCLCSSNVSVSQKRPYMGNVFSHWLIACSAPHDGLHSAVAMDYFQWQRLATPSPGLWHG